MTTEAQENVTFDQAWDELVGTANPEDAGASAATDATLNASEAKATTDDGAGAANEVTSATETPTGAAAANAADVDWKAKAAELESKLAEQSDKFVRQAGQVSAYQRKYDALLEETRAQGNKLAKLSQAATVSPEAYLETLKADYPALYEPVSKALAGVKESVRGELLKELRGEINQAVAPFEQARQESIANAAVDVLLEAHQDAPQIVVSPEYKTWLAEQPEDLRKLHFSPDPAAAVKLLRLFKAEKGTVTPSASSEESNGGAEDKKQRLRETVAPTAGARRAATSALPPDDFDAAWEHYSRNS